MRHKKYPKALLCLLYILATDHLDSCHLFPFVVHRFAVACSNIFSFSRKKCPLVILANLIYDEFRTHYGYPSPFH